MSRYISEKTRKFIVGKQRYKCNNHPSKTLRNLENYSCPLWEREDDPGSFDETGFHIDHINEFSVTRDNSNDNLQALCVSCHKEKTSKFYRVKKIATKSNKGVNNGKIESPSGVYRYKCCDCQKLFKQKSHYTYHCVNNSCKVREFTCRYCDKKFTVRTNMYRHIRNTCAKKSKKDNLSTNRDIHKRFKTLEMENKILKDRVTKLEKQSKIDCHDNETIFINTRRIANRPGTKRKKILK